MTKAELYDLSFEVAGGTNVISTRALTAFFEQNVCIPKGENRHPYADVLHAWVEGVKVEFAMKSSDSWSTCQFANELKYRIKPYEPIYEYLYYDRAGRTCWSIKDNAPINMWCAEETKRERK